jgi:hypothetical protein
VAESQPDSDGFNEFRETVRCADDTWRVRLDQYSGSDFETFVSTYFMVSESKGAYRLREINDVPAGECAASDTIASRE